MTEIQKPHEQPESSSWQRHSWQILCAGATAVKNGIARLMHDPAFDGLPEDFKEKFVNDYYSMLQDLRAGADLTWQDQFRVAGWDAEYRMFKIVLNESTEIRSLPEPQRKAVVAALMKECGLPGTSCL